MEKIVATGLISEFQNCTQIQYSGQLHIQSAKGSKWTFYYRLGRIVWATGGTHPFRRWRRFIAQYCSNLDIEKMQLSSQDISIDYWDYRLLENLYEKQQIKREQVNLIVENTLAELLFDLAQQANFSSISCERSQKVILDMPMSFTSADTSLKQMQDSWKNWSEAGLANFSPNLAPILLRPELLQTQVSSGVYKNLVTLINGKQTLRELALKMKQNVLPVTRSLLPYILKGTIELVEIPDLPLPIIAIKNKSVNSKAKTSSMPLVACIDDSPQVCQILEQMLVSQGFRFVQIQDALQALPTLIEHKPDIIFLDLIMPVINGYEICAQLRRISLFANTPIIILTGNDGLLDRVRAKVVGSTGFMTKPISTDKVMDVIKKYIPVPAKV
ncbi:response regulator [Chlorogloeopsis fritschii PCC 9212]|uniref:Protein PatA n=1 Tax=Chlorogloeopsis fritschii PCC 6912 TaxID=211165 RepID=A0A3S0XQ27_CHLFR|nr:response regulator [Chlorogloeopsis fritschii]RUR75091.1 two-component system response regulator [Chlorogloeopsis fritschii PCC 6912]